MKKIAFLILIAVAMMACDKIVESPVAEREVIEQAMDKDKDPELGSKNGTDEIIDGDEPAEDINNNLDDKRDGGSRNSIK